jgi:hypothetical protein
MDLPATVHRHDDLPDLNEQVFLQVPNISSTRSPDDGEEDEEASCNANHEPIKGQYSCYEYVQIKTINGSDHSQKVAVLLAMRIGLDDVKFPFFVDKEPFISLPKHNKIKMSQQVLGEEIVRRCNEYALDIVKPAQWKKEKQMTWLKKNPIPSIASDDLEFVKMELERVTAFAREITENAKAHGASMKAMRKNWSNYMPWLRFYLALAHSRVMPLFLLRHTPKSREQMEAVLRDRNRDTGEGTDGVQDWRVALCNIFNDVNWVPQTESLPDLHHDFAVSFSVPLTVDPISSPEEVKQRFTQARGPLVLMINQWERSGNGSAMLEEEPTERISEEQVYKFVDGDDRQAFLRFANNKTHVLYFWDLAYKHQLLTSAREHLKEAISGDGNSVPSISPMSNSNSGGGRMSPYQMEQLTQLQDLGGSITELVGAMQKQSETQELGSAIADLYKNKEDIVRRRDKLETEMDDLEFKLALSDDQTIKVQCNKILKRKKDQKTQAEIELNKCETHLAHYISRRNSRLSREEGEKEQSLEGESRRNEKEFEGESRRKSKSFDLSSHSSSSSSDDL